MDFLHDQLATGNKIRVLTVVDTFSRFSPALDARFSCRGEDVVATLERVCRTVGYPKAIQVDPSSEFISRDLDLWAYAKGVTLDSLVPGKPTDNAFAEAFNSRVRAECMNAHWFLTLADAREKVGGLAQILQRGEAARRHRQQGADLVAETRRRSQPVAVTKAGNSSLQRSRVGPDQLQFRGSAGKLQSELHSIQIDVNGLFYQARLRFSLIIESSDWFDKKISMTTRTRNNIVKIIYPIDYYKFFAV